MIQNIILISLIVVILGGAAVYIYRQKKKCIACIGCPCAGKCGKSECECGEKAQDSNK